MSAKKTKLELTWIGKEHRPKLEPRILLEEPDKSHHANHRVSDGDLFDNMLIRGDNLLGLKALEQEFAGKVKCVYIDPPFNTGDMFENYDDGLEHSIWLSQMRDRFELFHRLLSDDGSIFVHLNDDELDYCKILLDEKFMRKNFVNRITVSARSPSAFSTVNPGVFKASEYLLWFAKDRSVFKENGGRVARTPDYAYNKWIENPDESYERWKLVHRFLNNCAFGIACAMISSWHGSLNLFCCKLMKLFTLNHCFDAELWKTVSQEDAELCCSRHKA
jgi:adenine-specific DNA-methyltransferase